jgi:hypothetical protein
MQRAYKLRKQYTTSLPPLNPDHAETLCSFNVQRRQAAMEMHKTQQAQPCITHPNCNADILQSLSILTAPEQFK